MMTTYYWEEDIDNIIYLYSKYIYLEAGRCLYLRVRTRDSKVAAVAALKLPPRRRAAAHASSPRPAPATITNQPL